MSLSFSTFVDSTGSELLEELSNERIVQLVNDPKMDLRRVLKSTGIKSRFILKEKYEPVDLGTEVGQRLFQQLNITAAQCRGLGVLHTNYDTRNESESIAHDIANRLGITRGKIFSLSYGCSGFAKLVMMGEEAAGDLQESEHFPLLTVETPDRMMDAHDKFATPLFAAGAAGTTLIKGEGHRHIFSDSRDVVPPDTEKDVPIFTVDQETVEDFFGKISPKVIFRMKGDLAYSNGLRLIAEAARESARRLIEIDPQYRNRRILIVPHQPNSKMILWFDQYIAPEIQKEFGFPSVRFVNGMEGMGNTIGNTIPSTISRIHLLIDPPPQKGDIILMPSAGICIADPGGLMSQGFGAMEW
jgi:3-oxoacyl-[acyl-carrier-protein] synthase III